MKHYSTCEVSYFQIFIHILLQLLFDFNGDTGFLKREVTVAQNRPSHEVQ